MLALSGCTVVRIDNTVCDVKVQIALVVIESCRTPAAPPGE